MTTINFNLRISEEMNERLVEIAEEQGRSKNKQIEQILKEFIENYDKAKNKKAIQKEAI